MLASGISAVGVLALLSAPAMAGCVSGNTGTLLTSAACQASAIGQFATAVGDGAKGSAINSVALGTDATAANRATSIGTFAGRFAGNRDGVTSVGFYANRDPAGRYSTAIGGGSVSFGGTRSLGDYSIAIGGGDREITGIPALADGQYGIAIGTGSTAIGLRSTAVGSFAGDGAADDNAFNSAFGDGAGRFVTGQGNTGLGLVAGRTVEGDLNSAFGNSAGQEVTGHNNTAGGVSAGGTVKGSSNVAFGDNAGHNVNGNSNIAIGRRAGRNITAANTIAIGTKARATATQAVAIGSRSLANVANTVSVGSASNRRRIMNVAPGKRPTDAVNLAQLQAATAAVAAPPAAQSAAGNGELTALRALVNRLEARILQLESRMVAAAPAE